MNTIHTLLQKRFTQEILGGVLGVIVAVAFYFFGAELPSMQVTKGLLVDPSATTVNEEATVRVNDTTADEETIARLAARAEYLRREQEANEKEAEAARLREPEQPQEILPVTPEQAVADHIDPTGWQEMRENRRELASAFDLSVQEVKAEEPDIVAADPVIEALPTPPSDEEMAIATQAIEAPLPDSGPMLNTVIVLTLVVVGCIRRRSLVAMLHGAPIG